MAKLRLRPILGFCNPRVGLCLRVGCVRNPMLVGELVTLRGQGDQRSKNVGLLRFGGVPQHLKGLRFWIALGQIDLLRFVQGGGRRFDAPRGTNR